MYITLIKILIKHNCKNKARSMVIIIRLLPILQKHNEQNNFSWAKNSQYIAFTRLTVENIDL